MSIYGAYRYFTVKLLIFKTRCKGNVFIIMDILALTHAIYWLLGVASFLCLLVITWNGFKDKFWMWLACPGFLTTLGCFYTIVAPAYVLICSAVAVLCGMLMYASGCALALSIIVAILIAIFLPILMMLAVVIVIAIVLIVGIFLYCLCIWTYFGIQGEINKAKSRRAKRKKAKEKKAQENKTE